jgi:hypothetical protein
MCLLLIIVSSSSTFRFYEKWKFFDRLDHYRPAHEDPYYGDSYIIICLIRKILPGPVTFLVVSIFTYFIFK